VGILRIGKGIVTGDLGMIGRGIRTLGSALLIPRAGSASGLGWPGTPGNTGITPATGTKLDNASIWHDTFTAVAGLGSAAQFGWIERAWTGPGRELGLFGQAYRLVGTAAFGLAGATQAAAGF
jgi:hypothetical protein